MTSRILATGGTGTLGRHVVPLLRDAGREVRVLSHHPDQATAGIEQVTGDLATGEGIDAAVQGTEVVLHLAGSAKGDDVKAMHLVRAASRAGVRHLVFISVVGADRIPVVSGVDRAMFGYYAAKRAAEQQIAGSGLGWTTLRATQVPPPDAADRAPAGPAAGGPGPGRVALPADRPRGGGRPAGGTGPNRTGGRTHPSRSG